MAPSRQDGRLRQPLCFVLLGLLLLQAASLCGALPNGNDNNGLSGTSLNERYPHLLIRRATADYEDEVCHPAVRSPTEVVPPCTHIETIETICTPNGTEPIHLAAHAQCMCQGSFFPEWDACLACLFVHGLRSERDVAFYKSVLGVASSSLCAPLAATGPAAPAPTPTSTETLTATTGGAGGASTPIPAPPASFAAIFTSVLNASPPVVPVPTTGATVSSDLFPSRTEVSLYFTPAPGQPLGPGRITGDAVRATASGLFMAPPSASPTIGGMPDGVGGGGAAGGGGTGGSGGGRAGGSGGGQGGAAANASAQQSAWRPAWCPSWAAPLLAWAAVQVVAVIVL